MFVLEGGLSWPLYKSFHLVFLVGFALGCQTESMTYDANAENECLKHFSMSMTNSRNTLLFVVTSNFFLLVHMNKLLFLLLVVLVLNFQ